VQLPIESIGYLAAQRLTQAGLQLKIHSRFQHAMNFMADDGYLLTLLDASKYPNLPDAVRLQLPPGWDWREMSGKLAGLNSATLWQLRLPLVQTGEGSLHYATLAEELGRQAVESELMLLPGGDASKRQPLISPEDSAQQLTFQVSQLIGFGRGLTPDGDDYLLGYLAALWRWQNAPRIAGHYRQMQQIIAAQLAATNDISAHYLGRALHGHFSEPLCNLLLLLTHAASGGEIRAAAQNMMQCGASSGTDCLAGLLHGIRTLQTAL
jgi:hypothetical protein